MSYISVIERYHEYRGAVRELLASMLTGIAETRLLGDPDAQRKAMYSLAQHYPFSELLYVLDAKGIQTGENISGSTKFTSRPSNKGKDRSQRPYYLLARDSPGVIVTDPYLSNADNTLCMTAAVRLCDEHQHVVGYMALDVDLAKTIEFLMGDTSRRHFQPFFKVTYSLIVVGLFSVVVVLLYVSFQELAGLIHTEHNAQSIQLRPFSVIIFMTLALAVFDLGKTILEEEVLMHKDILRHSSTRRTITRFIAAILIAVSIEALLLIFKAALGNGADMLQGVWMMITAAVLLVGLGLYVYLGARAETLLLSIRK